MFLKQSYVYILPNKKCSNPAAAICLQKHISSHVLKVYEPTGAGIHFRRLKAKVLELCGHNHCEMLVIMFSPIFQEEQISGL